MESTTTSTTTDDYIDLTLASTTPSAITTLATIPEEPPLTLIPVLLFSVDPSTANMGSLLSAYAFDEKTKTVYWWIFTDYMNCKQVHDGAISDLHQLNLNVLGWLQRKLEKFLQHVPTQALIEHQYFNPYANKAEKPDGSSNVVLNRNWHASFGLRRLGDCLFSNLQSHLKVMTHEIYPNIYKPKLGISTGEYQGNKKVATYSICGSYLQHHLSS